MAIREIIILPDKQLRLVSKPVEKVTADSDTQATFHLKQPQPSLLALLAAGYTPIYACHVPVTEYRRKPIGTGPFKLAEFKMNESIKLVKNPDYWKKGLPYLDGIEFSIIPDRSTRMLAFVSGKFDMTFPTDVSIPLLKNVKADAPHAQRVVVEHYGRLAFTHIIPRQKHVARCAQLALAGGVVLEAHGVQPAQIREQRREGEPLGRLRRVDRPRGEGGADCYRALVPRAIHELVAVLIALQVALARERLEILRNRIRRAVAEDLHDLAVRRPDPVLSNVAV